MFIVLAISLISCCESDSDYEAEEKRLELKLKELRVLKEYYNVRDAIQAEKDLKYLMGEQETTVDNFDSLFPKTK